MEEGGEKESTEHKIIEDMCTIFELLCNIQSSRAFKLAAAYLQVKKGTKEINNNKTIVQRVDSTGENVTVHWMGR